MPEENVEFNMERVPPREYLMRRSYQPLDAEFPGAVVREWRCPGCGVIVDDDPRARVPMGSRHEFMDVQPFCDEPAHERDITNPNGHGPRMQVYSVDVPLVKSDGEKWR